MKKTIRNILLLIMILLSPVIASFGESPGPPNPGGNPPNGGGVPVGAPIDGGLSILLVLGIGYGSRKIYQIKKDISGKKK